MAKPYTVPDWARHSPEALRYSLEVIKDGAVVDEIELLSQEDPQKPQIKSYYILGRQPDIVDILLEHPSLSRQHAVLQFRDDDALMCLDFNSAQGTFVNKVQLEQGVYQRIYVGDILKFGQSTRLYVVKGPESQMKPEYDSENLQQMRKKLKERSVEVAKKKEESNVATWGFDDDAEEDNDDGYDDSKQGGSAKEPDYLRKDPNYYRKFGSGYTSKLKDSDVDPKDATKLAKIRAKEQKIQNMLEENRRIYVKETSQDDGLTEGQSAAVARNDGRIEELKSEIETMINELLGKKKQRDGGTDAANNTSKGKKRSGSDDEDDDDLYDQTMDTQDVNTNWRLKRKLMKQMPGADVSTGAGRSQGMTYLEIKSWVESLRSKQIAVEQEIAANEAHIRAADNKNANDGDEDLDDLLLKSNATTAKLDISRLKSEHTKVAVELKKAEKLLVAATPALKFHHKSEEQTQPVPPGVSSKVAEVIDSLLHPQAPVVMHSQEENTMDVDSTLPISAATEPIELKEEIESAPERVVERPPSPVVATKSDTSRVLGPQRPAQTQSQSQPQAQPQPESQHESIGEAATSDDVPHAHTSKQHRDSSPKGHTHKKIIKEPTKFDSSTLQDGEKVWVKPKNQTGDGKTWLNDKFGY
jgi:hypothetical protein